MQVGDAVGALVEPGTGAEVGLRVVGALVGQLFGRWFSQGVSSVWQHEVTLWWVRQYPL